jgi:heterodisulfide reductase subunit A
MVFVGACHLPTDCHYISGNVWMKERMEALHSTLTKQGMSPERLLVSYVSAAEGLIFANVMKKMDQQMKDLGVDRIKEENAGLRPYIEKILGKKGLLSSQDGQ